MNTSRRWFLASAAAAGAVSGQTAAMTVGDVIERIKKGVAVPWRAETVDTIKAGTAETRVKGIATTMMATFDVLRKASAAGLNFVITHEPTFYNHEDKTSDLTGNATWQAKDEFLRKNDMAVFRFHDHWHARRPDGIATGMIEELNWSGNADPQNPRLFRFDNVTLAELVRQMQSRLKVRSMRVVGDPALRVRTATANWGYTNQMGGIRALSRPDVDVLIIGEAREWEVVEFAADTITAGNKKALILLGHVASEQGGMKYCAKWLKSLVSEVPVEFVPAEEPFWTPAV
jgi:putative NIF3 family GTP cyclohydrolase 1 type 2